MKVWIVTESDYDYHSNLRVCSSEQKAKEELEKLKESYKGLSKYAQPYFGIEEMEVDE